MNIFSIQYRIGILIGCLFIIMPSLVKAQEWYELRVIILEAKVELDNLDKLNDVLNGEASVYQNPQEHIAASLEATKKIALHIGSDMIYGRRFTFVPQDRLRGIEESWNFEPVSYIRADDPNLYDISREFFENQIIVVFRYDLGKDQYDWLSLWESASILTSGGVGFVPIIEKDQVKGQQEAILDAYKVAIKSRLKERIINKPLEVRGVVKLSEQPYTTKTGGYYRAKVKVLIKIEEVKEHQAY